MKFELQSLAVPQPEPQGSNEGPTATTLSLRKAQGRFLPGRRFLLVDRSQIASGSALLDRPKSKSTEYSPAGSGRSTGQKENF
jgi:hypothetical protein